MKKVITRATPDRSLVHNKGKHLKKNFIKDEVRENGERANKKAVHKRQASHNDSRFCGHNLETECSLFSNTEL